MNTALGRCLHRGYGVHLKPMAMGVAWLSLTAHAEPDHSFPSVSSPKSNTASVLSVSATTLRQTQVSEPLRVVDADTPNKINTPNTSKDLKSLNSKQGKDLPLGTQRVGNEDKTIEVDKVEVRAKRFYEIGPLPGLGLTKEEIPGNVQSITAKEIKESNSLSLTDLLNKKLQSVNVNDYQGNPFQMDITYRGFTAGPQIGTPQGLSVFFDGIRVNEPFGDIVNWDMIPLNAIAGVDVFPGSNPIFGLNTLGGAFTMKTKDGFNNAGADAKILSGSFGRKQLQVEGGWNNGTVGLFAAGNFFLEDGWRQNSPSRVNQLFTKGSYRGEKLDLNLSGLFVQTNLVGNGLVPSEMYAQQRDGVFTSPDRTKNTLDQYQLSGSYFVNDTFTITGQLYRRNSKRQQKGADVYTQYGGSVALANLAPGSQITCLYNSTNTYRLPDYYVIKVPSNADAQYFANKLVSDFNNQTGPFDPAVMDPANPQPEPTQMDYDLANQFQANYQNNNQFKFYADTLDGKPQDLSLIQDTFNQTLPDYYVKYAQYNFNLNKNFRAAALYTPQANGASPNVPPNEPSEIDLNGDGITTKEYGYLDVAYTPPTTPGSSNPVDVVIGNLLNYYFTQNAAGAFEKNILLTANAINSTACAEGRLANPNGNMADHAGYVQQNPDGTAKQYDGFLNNSDGVVEGVPTAVITNTQIDQITDGGSLQFNWNLDHHKFMVGASLDAAKAKYVGGQQLGFLDSNRNAYLAPDQALDGLIAADMEIFNNNFDGTSVTRSLYASETWSPVDNLHFSSALRLNHTRVKNTLASRSYGYTVPDLHQLIGAPDEYNICLPGQDCPTGYRIPEVFNLINPPETEQFTYKSLNPSLGVSWQVRPELNMYANWAKGTRVPSVIELGCALDKTLVNGVFKSLVENRACSLPSTLSGDPYLPQIRATTFDVGLRGQWGNNIEWNVGAYRTDLQDDIYLVTFPGNRSFFDTIGNTRRQGLEMGMSGKVDRLGFRVNYALTDATFQDTFTLASDDNSSGVPDPSSNYSEEGVIVKFITVKPGNRMPGVPLHNFNASLSYDLTDDWNVGLTAVAHSESFVRGNENNQHQQGVRDFITIEQQVQDPDNPGQTIPVAVQIERPRTNNPGKVAGYMTFNFQTAYKISKSWTASLLINNLLDKEYFSAGRLGRNPFSPNAPGNNGAIGPDGYNHNSANWLSTNFIAPGAPRGIWFTLNWTYEPEKKY